MSERIAVIGAGAWGTSLAVLLAHAGKEVTLWARDPDRAAALHGTRLNDRLPGITLPANLAVTGDMPAADILLLAVPMRGLRAVTSLLPQHGARVLCAKGLEPDTLLLPPEMFPNRGVAVLTGPNFAHEIAALLPAASVLAATDASLRARLISALQTPTLRLYGSADVIGAALGGAAKNVIAIAAGVVMGAGLGENARAALITRGIAEIGRLASSLGGKAETIAGLSGMGDLLLTCTGASSRPHRRDRGRGHRPRFAGARRRRCGGHADHPGRDEIAGA
jgi:glycerol-3-phosphate dehydrogenase (NAD(P)+)